MQHRTDPLLMSEALTPRHEPSYVKAAIEQSVDMLRKAWKAVGKPDTKGQAVDLLDRVVVLLGRSVKSMKREYAMAQQQKAAPPPAPAEKPARAAKKKRRTKKKAAVKRRKRG